MEIEVNYQGACTRCGCVNDRSSQTMESTAFEKLAAEFPKEYWKTEKDGKVEYFHHEETSSSNCRRSC